MTITFSEEYSTFNDEFSTADGAFYHYNGSTYVADADNANMDYFSDTAQAGDSLIAKMSANGFHPPNKFRFNVGTAIVATDLVLKWYMGTQTSRITAGGYHEIDWEDITAYVTDNTNGFTTLGLNTVDFAQYVNERICAGKFTPITTTNATWIKCEIDSLTSITEGGANITDKVRSYYNRMTVTGVYDSGTVTSATSDNYFVGNTYSDYELMGKHVWFPNSTAEPAIHSVAYNYLTSRIYIGAPISMHPSTYVSFFDTRPTVGDDYYILYTVEDLRLAAIAAGKDWVTATTWLPREQEYRDYRFNCEVYINAGGTSNYGGVGTLSKNIHMNFGMRFFCNGSYKYNNIMADGMRARQRNITNTAWTSSDKITMYGSQFYWEGHGVSTYSGRLCGYLYGTTFHNSCSYSFVTYQYMANLHVINVKMENVQLGDGTETTGWNLMHSPVAEPLRVPANTFAVKNFQANKSCIYQTSGVSRSLDSPASADQYPFTAYSGFTTPHRVEIIDKEENTLKLFRYGAASATLDSGTFAMWYRLNIKVLDTNNNPIDGAEVRVYNKDGVLQFSTTTDSTGNTPNEYNDSFADVTNKVLSTEHYHIADGSTGTKYDFVEINYNPFTVVIKKAGYETPPEELNIEKAENLVFNMRSSTNTRRL